MNKICTSIEQSKKLIKLGIDLKTADMIWHRKLDGTHSLRVDDILLRLDTPAWSLAALLAVFPKIGANEPKLCMRYYVDAPLIRYVCTYGLLKDTKEYDNPIDACYEMVVWLKENGKI